MKFSQWLLSESIIVQWGRDQGVLTAAIDVPNKEFNYQFGDGGFSSFYIGGYQAKRQGYVSISNQATHVGIIKTSAIEHGENVNLIFMRNLVLLLKKNGLRAVPYKEVGSSFDDMFNKVGFKPEDPVQTGFQSGENLPDFELGQSNSHKVSPGISVSSDAGSWAYYIETREANWLIPQIINIMLQAVQPLVDSDAIDFYEVVDRRSGKRERVVYSQKGQKEHDDWKSKDSRVAAQLKYLAVMYLSNAPTFSNDLMGNINADGIKGGETWFAKQVKPQNTNVPLQDIYELNKRAYAEDIVIKTFLDAVRDRDTEKITKLEKAAKWADTKKQADVGQKYPPYWLGGALERLSWFWDDEHKVLEGIFDDILYNLSTLHSIIKYDDLLEATEPEAYADFKSKAKEAIEAALSEEPNITANMIKYLNDLAGPLQLHPSIVHSLEQQNQKIKDQELEAKQKREQERIKQSFLMPDDSYAYMMVSEGEWKSVPSKFLNYLYGKDEIDIGELALHLVGEEDTWEDAYSRAEEEANEDVESRPSESYGEKKDEVEGDMGYYYDDFINDNSIEVPEDASDDQIIDIIKKDYYDDFVDWRIKKMQEEEEEESWKYEPDTESNEFQIKVYDYQKEVAEEMAWEQGMVILTRDAHLVDITLAKKHWEAFKSILKKTINLNFTNRDEEFDEPLWKASTKVAINFVPKGGFTKSAYELLQSLNA